ncbi:hypothetical protein YC2023_046235 [Brassica napus]
MQATQGRGPGSIALVSSQASQVRLLPEVTGIIAASSGSMKTEVVKKNLWMASRQESSLSYAIFEDFYYLSLQPACFCDNSSHSLGSQAHSFAGLRDNPSTRNKTVRQYNITGRCRETSRINRQRIQRTTRMRQGVSGKLIHADFKNQ